MKSQKPIMPRRLLQRLDTSHGPVGDGPNLSPGKLEVAGEPVLRVDLSGVAEAHQPRSGIGPARRHGVHEMRVYKTQHQYYCGVDLHARSLFVNILDSTGTTRFEQDLPASSGRKLDEGLDSLASSRFRRAVPSGSSHRFE